MISDINNRSWQADRGVRRVAIVAYDGVELLDLTGPLDVFAMANLGLKLSEKQANGGYAIEVLASEPGAVQSASGLRVYADKAYGTLRDDIDTLLIPGSPDLAAVLVDPGLAVWIGAMSTRVRRMVSICTGAFLLAEAGLLNGRRATTHWAFCDQLSARYPDVHVEPDHIFLNERGIATSGGITSGIDLALSLVEEDWGPELALLTARYMVVLPNRPGGQSQFSESLIRETTERDGLRELQLWIMENPSADLKVEVLAERLAMSPRNFARLFKIRTGMTPAKFVEKARIDAARRLLATTEDRIETIAATSGFGDSERMRRSFLRHLGINPCDYRNRFGRPDGRPMATIGKRL